MKNYKILPFKKIFIFVHDGVYTVSSGAGNSNLRFIKTILNEYGHSQIIVCPIRANMDGPFFNKRHFEQVKESLMEVGGTLRPVDNGSNGLHPFGSIENWLFASNSSIMAIEEHMGNDVSLILTFDTPFIYMIEKLVKYNNLIHVHVPRSTGIIQNGADTKRILIEKCAFQSVNAIDNSYVGATSKYMFTHLVDDYKIQKKKILELLNGVLISSEKKYSQSELTRIERKIGLQNNQKYILSYGRGVPYKGFHILLKALSLIEKKHRPLFIIIAAEFFIGSSYIRQLKDIIHSKQLNGVLLTKFDVNLPRQLQQSNNLAAIVVPSLEEPFGLIPIENYANPLSSAPIIASNIGGLREQVIDKKTGFVFIANDPRSLSLQITKALNIPFDKKINFKANGYEIVKAKYDYEKNIRLFMERTAILFKQ